jgi:DNA polymerase III epsilon subunit family exonuclease
VATEWWNDKWLAYDTETTGPDPETAKIVQVGSAIFQGRQPIKQFQTNIDPECDIPPESTEIHGITNEMVKGAPTIKEFGAKFATYCKGFPVLIGYNCYNYDSHILERELAHKWRQALHGSAHLDVFAMVGLDKVGRYWRGKGRHKLQAVCERLEIDIGADKFHGAGADSLATGLVLAALLKDPAYEAEILALCPADPELATKQLQEERDAQQKRILEYIERKRREEAAAGEVDPDS